MRTFQVIFLLIIVTQVRCISNTSNKYSQEEFRKDSLFRIVANLGEENIIGDCIGIICSRNKFNLYNGLNKIATNNELINFTNHENPAVRYYAFRALVNRRNEKVFEILLNHMTDTMRINSFSGCSWMEETVSWNLIRLVTSNENEPNGYKINKSQSKIVDSMLQRHPDPIFGPFAE